MPSDNLPEVVVDDSRGARLASGALAGLAAVLVFANCLLNSPSRFSEKHAADTTLLKPIVTALGLGGHVGTARGVEVRNLVFYGGAALILAVSAIRLLTTGRRPRYSLDDLLDYRARAGSPYFWWALWMVSCGLSSYFSHAPAVCRGQAMAHILWLAWWWPLAAMLTPRHVRALTAALAIALTATAALALAYQAVRGGPSPWTARLSYPFGNELWLAACLLPGVPIAIGLALGRNGGSSARRPVARWAACVAWVVVAVLILIALMLTRSRSGLAGLVAAGLAMVCLLIGKKARRVLLLIALVGGLGGAAILNRLASEGGTATRSHSIRTRVNFEWPYAMRLLMDKPVLGHGDGAYSMLAGQFAREDQLEDPMTLRFDEQFWTGHAHNEYLEQAAEIGVVGAGAYLVAMILTLIYVARACDQRGDGARMNRFVIAGLGAALVGLAVDHFGEPSIREPGGPAVFLTVWALAWAAVRRGRTERFEMQEAHRLSNGVVRLSGVALLVAVAWLGLAAFEDWHGAIGRAQADAAMAEGDFEDATAHADYAAARTMDPFQRNLARLIAIRSRALAFQASLDGSEALPDAAMLNRASDAVIGLSQLRADVPRFLQLSRLEADLALNLGRAAQRRGDGAAAAEYQRRWIQALERQHADEPFSSQIVWTLWRVSPAASARQRIDWLRALLRGGFVDAMTAEMVQGLLESADLPAIIEELTNVAMADATRSKAADWQDRFSPETLRLAAMRARRDDESPRAMNLAAKAAEMYERAGPGLFAARAAAISEWVEYDVAAHGGSNADANLRKLADAASILWGARVSPSDPQPGALGRVRLRVLESAGRDREAKAQRAYLRESSHQ